MFCYIAHGATKKSNRMNIIVHRQELIRQTANSLKKMDVEFGVIAAGHDMNLNHPVQLCMVQTLANRPDLPLDPQVMVVDEFHHGVSETYLAVRARFPKATTIGFTATPQRLDGKGLGSICEELILGPSVQYLMDNGYLSRPIYYAPPNGLDMTGVKKQAGDFNKKQMGERVDRPKIIGSAVEHYARICPGVPAIAFCVNIKHAEHVRDQFIAAGYRSSLIEGRLSDDDREKCVTDLASGAIDVLVSVDVVSEGFDLPMVTAGILLRPTESLALALQQFGRVLRPKADGSRCIILDHVGNVMRHGMAEEPREWSLEGHAEKKKASTAFQVPLGTCPECFAVHPSAPCCPQCGHQYPFQERMIEEVKGTLKEITAEDIAEERAKTLKRMEVGRAETKEQLEAIAEARGYKPSWVTMQLWLRRKKQFLEPLDRQQPLAL